MATSILARTTSQHSSTALGRPPVTAVKRYVVLLTLWLLGCQSPPTQAAAPIPSTPACEEPGTVELGKLEETQRGYAYQYRVYLPPCYDHTSEISYPVLFLIPGSGSRSTAWFSAGIDGMADELILSGQVPPFLMVATESTDADPDAEIIFDELIPRINSEYRIVAGSEHWAVAGASLGGIGAYRLVFQHPERFGNLGVFGSGVMPGQEGQLLGWLNAVPPSDQPRVFVNCGEEDAATIKWAKLMIGLLEDAGSDVTSIITPGGHTYAYWASNFDAYLRWLAQAW